MRQGRRKWRLIPAGLTSFSCRRWNTKPQMNVSQCLAAKLPLYMLQISPFLQVSLVLTDESFCQYLAAELVVQTKRFFSSSLPFSLIFSSFCSLPFLLFSSPFSSRWHQNASKKLPLFTAFFTLPLLRFSFLSLAFPSLLFSLCFSLIFLPSLFYFSALFLLPPLGH